MKKLKKWRVKLKEVPHDCQIGSRIAYTPDCKTALFERFKVLFRIKWRIRDLETFIAVTKNTSASGNGTCTSIARLSIDVTAAATAASKWSISA